VPGDYLTDHLACGDGVARPQRRHHRFIARNHAASVGDRKHGPIDHEANEVHDAGGWCEHVARRGDVDASMSGGVGGRGRDERTDDGMFASNRPRPASRNGWHCRTGGFGNREQREHCDQQDENA
jgi:hypothetical protein